MVIVCKNSEWMVEWEVEWCGSCYFVLLQLIGKMFYSSITDLIIMEFKYGECLRKIASAWLNGEESIETRVYFVLL
jgi:hypothetical protein